MPTRILVINHKSASLSELVNHLRSLGVEVAVEAPLGGGDWNTRYDGVILSGGALPKADYRQILAWYGERLRTLRRPLLGICLGLKIIGYCYGARIRKLEADEKGVQRLEFTREFPLAPGRASLTVFEDHSFELFGIKPPLANCGQTAACKVQAVLHGEKPLFGVQFHPEIREGGNEGHVVLGSFVKLCQAHAERR